MSSSLQPLSDVGNIFAINLPILTGETVLLTWEHLYDNTNTDCNVQEFEHNSRGSTCHLDPVNYIVNNQNDTITLDLSNQRNGLPCFRAKTNDNVNKGCVDDYVQSSFRFRVLDILLNEKTTPFGDQTYDYDAATASFDVNPDGFLDFFDVGHTDYVNEVSCDLFGSDCSSALVCTEMDGTTPHASQYISMDSSNPFRISFSQDKVGGQICDTCIKCSYESKTPNNSVLKTTTASSTFRLTQNPDCGFTPRTEWEATYSSTSSLCLQRETANPDYLRLNPNGWSDLFNGGPSSCPFFQQCDLYRDDCTTSVPTLNGRASARLTFNQANRELFLELDLQSKQSDKQFCVSCTVDGNDFVQFKTGTINVNDILANKEPYELLWPTCHYYSQSANSDYHVASSYRNFLKNSRYNQCHPECNLYQSDCTTLYTQSNVIMEGPNNYGLKYRRDPDPNGYDHTVCIKCQHKPHGFDDTAGAFIQETSAQQTHRVVVRATQPDCTGVLSLNTAITPDYLTTVLPYQSSRSAFKDISSQMTNFQSWNHHFDNSEAPCCKITNACTLDHTTDSGLTWIALTNNDYIYISSNKIMAKQNVVEGYIYYLRITCQITAGNTIIDDRLIVQQTDGCSSITCDANALVDNDLAANSSIIGSVSFVSSIVAYLNGDIFDVIPGLSGFNSVNEVLAADSSTQSCCPITNCEVYRHFTCTSGVADPNGLEDCYNGSPWTASNERIYIELVNGVFEIKAKYRQNPYSFQYKITCSTDTGSTAHITGLSVSQTPVDCSSTLTSNPGVSLDTIEFYYDPLATSDHHVQSEFSSFFNSVSNTTNWDSHFLNMDTDNCPITACWLMNYQGTANLSSSPISMDSTSKNIFAQHLSGGTYTETFRVYCQNNGQVTFDNRLVVIQKVDCTGTLTDQTTTGVTIDYGIGSYIGGFNWAMLVPPSASSFTNWSSFFLNSNQTNCPVNCGAYYNGCTVQNPNVLYQGNQFYVVSNLNIQFTIDICIKCQTIRGDNDWANLDQAVLDNWSITVNNCETTKIVQPITPQNIMLQYSAGASDVRIFPDSQNKSWGEYFQSNPNCDLSICDIAIGGTCIDGTLDRASLGGNGFLSIDSSSPWALKASVSASSGYSINFCIICAGTYSNYIDNWKVSMSVFDCALQGIQKNTLFLDIGEVKTIQLSTLVNVTGNDYDQPECQTLQGQLLTSDNGFSILDQTISIDTSEPSLLDNSTIVTVTNEIFNLAQVTLSYFVCGYETINLKNSDAIVKTFNQNSGTNYQQVIELQEYASRFESSQEGCDVTNYRLITELSTGEVIELQDTQISMGQNFEIIVSTNEVITKTLLVEASTRNSNSTTVLELIVYVSNFAPYFQEGPPEHQQIQFDSSSNSFVFQIPIIEDQEELDISNITVQVSNLEQSFMVFDQELNQIQFFNMTNEASGNYSLEITLEDSLGKSITYTVTFEILSQTPDGEEADQESSDAQQDLSFLTFDALESKKVEEEFIKENLKICKAIIKKLDFFGQTKIIFSQKMNTDFDLSLIDDKVLDVFVQPALNRHLNDPTFDQSSLDLTWIPHSFEEYSLVLNVTFKNARAISPLEVQDMLVVKFKNVTWPTDPKKELFYAKDIDKTIDDSYRLIKKAIRRQLEDSEANRNFAASSEKGTEGMKAAMIFSFLVNFIMAGALGYMIAWINTLQLIIHLPMLRVLVPANVGVFFGTIIPIVAFDVIPPEWSTEFFLKFEDFPAENFQNEFDNKIFGQMQDLGYDSHNSVQILGSLWILSVLYFVRLLFILPLVILFSKFFKKLVGYHKDLRNQLIIGEWVTISLEAYFEFLIAGYLNIQYSLMNESGEKAGYFTSFYSLCVAIVILPAFMIYVLMQPLSTIQSEKFQQAFGSLYDGIKTDSKWKIGANMIFMIRRASFIFLCLNLGKLPGIQLVTVNLVNLFSCIYYCGVQPFDTRFRRRIDLFNEYSILLVTWHMMCFTNYVGEIDTQWLVGWSMIACIVFNAAVNIIIVLTVGGKMLFLLCKKYFNLVDRNYEKCCGRILKQYYMEKDPNSPRGFARAVQVLNTLDPFKVEISESDLDSNDGKGGQELDPQELQLRKKIAYENCQIIMASVLEREQNKATLNTEENENNEKWKRDQSRLQELTLQARSHMDFSFRDPVEVDWSHDQSQKRKKFEGMTEQEVQDLKAKNLKKVLYGKKYHYGGQRLEKLKENKLKNSLKSKRAGLYSKQGQLMKKLNDEFNENYDPSKKKEISLEGHVIPNYAEFKRRQNQQ